LNANLSLSPQHSQQLRDILLQGLRTSSRETTRDDFIIATMVFLAHLNPMWTTNHTSSKENKFVMAIVSLICGEYRLLLQELMTMSTERSEEGSQSIQDSQIHEQRFQRSINLMCVCSEIFDLIFSFLVGDVMDDDIPGCWQSLSSGTLQLIQKVSLTSLFR
jgi:hypothetical protein